MKTETNTAFYRRLKIYHSGPTAQRRYEKWSKMVIADINRHYPKVLKRPKYKPYDFKQSKKLALDKTIVADMKERRARGETLTAIGRSYNVHNTVVKEICGESKMRFKRGVRKRELIF